MTRVFDSQGREHGYEAQQWRGEASQRNQTVIGQPANFNYGYAETITLNDATLNAIARRVVDLLKAEGLNHSPNTDR